MKKISVSAPGKLHLLGEHAVVYGMPAILTAINKRCFIEIIPRKDNLIEIISKNTGKSKTLNEELILKKTKDAREKWQKFSKTNDSRLLRSIVKNIFDLSIITIGESLLFYKKNIPSGFTLIVNSEIPIGSGLGSSAALSVSVAGAMSLFLNKKLDKEKINKIAFLAEEKIHGFPSGGDNSTSCYGGFIWYEKNKKIKKLKLNLSKKIQGNFYIINTGKPSESTGEMVSMVKKLYLEDKNFVEDILLKQKNLVEKLLKVLKNNKENKLPEIIKQGEGNLEKLGVVSHFVKKIIRDVERSGGAAKICGAGGKKLASGIVIVYSSEMQRMDDLFKSNKLETVKINLGEEGLRKE